MPLTLDNLSTTGKHSLSSIFPTSNILIRCPNWQCLFHSNLTPSMTTSTYHTYALNSLCCIGLCWVNTATASCIALAVTIISVSVTIVSPLTLNAWHNHLIPALYLSKDKYSACSLDCHNWHVSVEVARAPGVNRRWSAHKTVTHISVDLVIVLFRVDVTCHTSHITVTHHTICCIWTADIAYII